MPKAPKVPKVLLDILERTAAAYVTTFLGLLLADGFDLTDVSALKAAAIAALPAALSVIKGAIGTRIGEKNSAAWLPGGGRSRSRSHSRSGTPGRTRKPGTTTEATSTAEAPEPAEPAEPAKTAKTAKPAKSAEASKAPETPEAAEASRAAGDSTGATGG
ncbi:holin [Streptomyces sp. NPDC008001]|uniref:holin n=1 Tax=Streptomyces sp. NPDC008001 TaxID=3364804 RepID=UPI0036DFE672